MLRNETRYFPSYTIDALEIIESTRSIDEAIMLAHIKFQNARTANQVIFWSQVIKYLTPEAWPWN